MANVDKRNAQVPELMGVKAVSELLGVKTSNLDRVAGLPIHAQRTDSGRVWRADVIREFAQKRDKR